MEQRAGDQVKAMTNTRGDNHFIRLAVHAAITAQVIRNVLTQGRQPTRMRGLQYTRACGQQPTGDATRPGFQVEQAGIRAPCDKGHMALYPGVGWVGVNRAAQHLF